VQRSLDGWNQHVYNVLQGRSEFEASGRMKDWDRWADLPKFKVRTLTLGARYDEMDPEDMRKMATLMPQGQSWISQTGSHFAMYDDQQNYFRALFEVEILAAEATKKGLAIRRAFYLLIARIQTG
jgi:proline iminopeptidase